MREFLGPHHTPPLSARAPTSDHIFFPLLFFSAVPSSTTLTSPIEPFPVSLNMVVSLRAGAFHIQIVNARLYGLEGQWSTFDVVPYTRDGIAFSSAQITALWTVRALRTLSNGANIQVRDFVTVNSPFPHPIAVKETRAESSLSLSPLDRNHREWTL